MWLCHSFDAFPLPPTPAGVAYLTDHDMSTPVREDGSQDIACHRITELESLRKAWQAWRWFTKVGIP